MSEEELIKKIQVVFILEMIGRPPEHLITSMNGILDNIKKMNGVKIEEEKIHDAKKLKERGDLYSTFAEIEAVFDNMEILSEVIFTYMPAHIEIIEPEELKLNNRDITAMITKIIRRLHQVDEIAKVLTIEKGILQNKLAEYEGTFKSEEKKKRRIKDKKKN